MREETEVNFFFPFLDSMIDPIRWNEGALTQTKGQKWHLSLLVKVIQRVETDILVNWVRQCRAVTKNSCSKSSLR